MKELAFKQDLSGVAPVLCLLHQRNRVLVAHWSIKYNAWVYV